MGLRMLRVNLDDILILQDGFIKFVFREIPFSLLQMPIFFCLFCASRDD